MDATANERAVAGKNFLKETPVIRAVATTVASGPVRLRLASGSVASGSLASGSLASGVRVNVRNLNQIGGPLPLVLLLAACGGGGGGGPVTSAPLPPTPAPSVESDSKEPKDDRDQTDDRDQRDDKDQTDDDGHLITYAGCGAL